MAGGAVSQGRVLRWVPTGVAAAHILEDTQPSECLRPWLTYVQNMFLVTMNPFRDASG